MVSSTLSPFSVSLIIPVYNAEEFIDRCLQSAITQDYDNLEIIVVDDGSTDKTAEKLAAYAADPKVRTFRIPNSGPSVARNTGLEEAKGKYLSFLDADDWLSPNYVSTLVQGMSNTSELGLVVSDYIEYAPYCREGKAIKVLDLPGSVEVSQFIKSLLLGNVGMLWGKLFNSKIIKERGLKLPENTTYQEDLVFLFGYLQQCEFVHYIPANTYHYNRLNEQSLTKSLTLKHADEFEKVQHALLSIAPDPDMQDMIRKRSESFYLGLIFSIGWNASNFRMAYQNLKQLNAKEHAANFSGKKVYTPFFLFLKKGWTFLGLGYLRTLKRFKNLFK